MYDEKTWSQWVLVPFWIVHIAFLLFFTAIIAYVMASTAGENKPYSTLEVTYMISFPIGMLSEPGEMVLKSYNILEPWLYLTSQVLKSLGATIFLAIAIWQNHKRTPQFSTSYEMTLPLLFTVSGMALTFYGSLAYGCVVMNKHRRKAADKGQA